MKRVVTSRWRSPRGFIGFHAELEVVEMNRRSLCAVVVEAGGEQHQQLQTISS